ncbi:hypothetical protein [Variovorax sp. Root473]|uniref:hypothetical protein n=1 Tax=Variovorax sp. Root473 TaxID=1736541 RepID=UPI0006F66136|nr:hypothetical protein [Variovorax sp. Root473]KQX94759.1 hypothetical protein ASD34_23720 [Variovorax sp. Root473]
MLDINAQVIRVHTDLVPLKSRFEFWPDTFSPIVGSIDSAQRQDFHQRFEKISCGGPCTGLFPKPQCPRNNCW